MNNKIKHMVVAIGNENSQLYFVLVLLPFTFLQWEYIIYSIKRKEERREHEEGRKRDKWERKGGKEGGKGGKEVGIIIEMNSKYGCQQMESKLKSYR